MAKAGTPAKKAGATKAPKAGKSLTLFDGKTQADAAAMTKALAIYGLKREEITALKSPAEILLKLRGVLAKKLEKLSDDDKIRCAECNEVSTEETDFCPFCGDKGEAPDAADASSSEEQAPASGPAPAKGPKAKAEAAEGSKTDAAIELAGVKLQKRIDRILALKADMAGNSYDLGLEIKAINDEELWKARGYKSLKEFVETDLNMSRALAYRLMDVCLKYDRKTFLEVGATKLALISSIKDEEEREKVLEEAKQGASTRSIETRARAAKGKAPNKTGTSEAPPPKKKPNEITLLAKVNGKAQVYGWRSASTGRPLAKHKDDSYVEIELSEGVRQRIALKVDKEGSCIGLAVQFMRVEAEAAE
jgi:hypothetical protein